jgi:hypothetical protein
MPFARRNRHDAASASNGGFDIAGNRHRPVTFAGDVEAIGDGMPAAPCRCHERIRMITSGQQTSPSDHFATPATEGWLRAEPADDATLSEVELSRIDGYWRAANYLSIGQIYLMANPLLREPLTIEHIKPRLLGHWGTTPGLNFVYAHLNRLIRARDAEVLYVAGPGHGGPGMVANTYLEGTYSERYPNIPQNAEGLRRLFTQFSFPGGIPSHVAPETPGSIHEGGELG